MSESYDATITFWPASALPASLVNELRLLGVELPGLDVERGSVTLYRTSDGDLALEFSLDDCYYGITGLEAVLARLRLARINYYAFDEGKDEAPPVGRSFHADTRVERTFSVLPDGTPVITLADLDPLEHCGSAEAALLQLRERLRRATPSIVDTLSAAELAIVIHDDESVPVHTPPASPQGGDLS